MARRFNIQPGGNHNNDPWLRVGTVGVTTTVFVAAAATLGMVLWALAPATTGALMLVPEKVRRGQVWRLVTWPLANTPSIGAVLSIGAFWWMASQVEDLLRRRRFAWYLGAIVLLPSIVAGLIGSGGIGATAGMGALSLAMIVAFAIEYPGARFFFGLKIGIIVAVVVAITLLQLIGSRNWTALLLYVVALLVVVTGLRSFDLAGHFSMFPKLPFLQRLSAGQAGGRSSSGQGATRLALRRTPGRRVGNAGRSAASNGKRKLQGLPPLRDDQKVIQGPWPTGPISQGEVDRLLDKIADEGIDSLSSEERRLLDDASRRLRQRHDE